MESEQGDLDLQHYYSERKAQYGELLNREQRILNRIAILRLAVIILAVYFLFLAGRTGTPLLYGVSAMMLVLFVVLVAYFKNHADQRALYRELVKLNEQELRCLEHDYADQPGGREYIDHNHPWSWDLDLFGEGSLYQYLNRTATGEGPSHLAGLLTARPGNPDEVPVRQEVLKELASMTSFRQHYVSRARLMEALNQSVEGVVNWANAPSYIEQKRWLYPVTLIMTGIAAGLITGGIFNPALFRFLLPLVLVNLFLLGLFVSRTNQYHDRFSNRHKFLSNYARLMELIAAQSFGAGPLREDRQRAAEGYQAVKKLSSLLNLFDQRLNLLVGLGLNMLFLFDYHMMHRLERWKRAHRDKLPGWIEGIHRMDAQVSLSGFAANHPDYTWPVLDPGMTGIEATEMGHPLIPPKQRVDNTLRVEREKVVLITGANMAGKSTFLRSVGINMVLAYAGCPVCASAFRSGYYELFTSMRTTDSLKDQESYFLAEIRRLKRAVEMMEQGVPLLILLDEVLKGTNTTDKQKGSIGLIQKALAYRVLGFIATHDLTLGKLEKEHPGEVVNYCFESYIDDLELSFDYTIRPGLAKNMNASFLMKKMGIMK